MWEGELKEMSGRINSMRRALVTEMKNVGSTRNWSHVEKQIGMFAYTGITPEQVVSLRDKHHVYMTLDGRISLAGLNKKNVQ